LHGDLKSDNVMLTGYPREPRVAITDFGLARALDPASRAAGTGGKGRAGSAAYMAPEQILGQDLGPETDLFCFGVVLFEMLCGSRPFRLDASGCRPVLGRGCAEAPPSPSALRPGVSGQLDALVLGCLNADSSARYQSAAHVLRMLELVFAGGGFDRVTPMDTPELHPLDLQACC
jgi:serine/threonine-protein kinase